MNSPVTLYQFPISHYCEKVRWALDFKHIEHRKGCLLPGIHYKTTLKIAKFSSVPILEHNNKFNIVKQGQQPLLLLLGAKGNAAFA